MIRIIILIYRKYIFAHTFSFCFFTFFYPTRLIRIKKFRHSRVLRVRAPRGGRLVPIEITPSFIVHAEGPAAVCVWKRAALKLGFSSLATAAISCHRGRHVLPSLAATTTGTGKSHPQRRCESRLRASHNGSQTGSELRELRDAIRVPATSL